MQADAQKQNRRKHDRCCERLHAPNNRQHRDQHDSTQLEASSHESADWNGERVKIICGVHFRILQMRRLKKTLHVSFLQHLLTILERRAGLPIHLLRSVWQIIDPLRKNPGSISTTNELALTALFYHIDVIVSGGRNSR